MNRPHIELEKPDISEHGSGGQTADERLYMQLQVFTDCPNIGAAIQAVQAAGLDGVVYEAMNDHRGIALLTFGRDPGIFIDSVRPLVQAAPFNAYTPLPAFTMIGRSYALGHEQDLNDTLFGRPRNTVLNPAWPWAIWYPLRRHGSFAKLDPAEQRKILMEHGKIGMAYVQADHVHDVRLACHGLDANDNDFVIGLIGRELTPLSKIVENMRKTTQTSQYLEKLGPFFVGRVAYQSRA